MTNIVEPHHLPEGIAWVILERSRATAEEKNYVYPFTFISVPGMANREDKEKFYYNFSKFGVIKPRTTELLLIQIRNPLTGQNFFNTYEDARMVLEDDGGDGYVIIPVLGIEKPKPKVAEEVKGWYGLPGTFTGPSSSAEKCPYHVGDKVRVRLPTPDEGEYTGSAGYKTWIIREMLPLDGEVFQVEDILKEDLVIFEGFEWLTDWLEPVEEGKTFKVGDMVMVCIPEADITKDSICTGKLNIGLLSEMKTWQARITTVVGTTEHSSGEPLYHLEGCTPGGRPNANNHHYSWISRWLKKMP